MKNPFREMSRPKALATAGIVAGAVAISGVAAAVNVGLLTGGDSAPFEPQKVSATEDGMVTTTTAPVEIVVQDVYEQAPAPTAPAAPVAPAPASSSSGDSDDSYDDHGAGTVYEDHESEDESDDHESEDHESEDHESEDDAFDD
jgi:hypothetical protein